MRKHTSKPKLKAAAIVIDNDMPPAHSGAPVNYNRAFTKAGEREFLDRIAALMEEHVRRIERMRSVERGDAVYKRHWRNAYRVSAHHVQGHWVTRVAPIKPVKPATKSKKS